MPDTAESFAKASDWNVLTSRWLDVMSLNAEIQRRSPLEALEGASKLRCITLASPLDFFAAHRFLLTLLYWKADASGGVKQLRESLLRGNMPRTVLDAIEKESHRFRLFDDKYPFLQDPSARKDSPKSVGSLSAEFASGTNIAHFHHGDDEKMRLCLRCASIGLLRVVPWTQSGGAGLTPSVHNAPPIMAVASGGNLAVTLGLNLVSLPAPKGKAKWTSQFKPTDENGAIPYLEALTWNPRRIYLARPLPRGEKDLPSPATGEDQGGGERLHENICWGCGGNGIALIGPIVYLKNKNTGKRSDKELFDWKDPSAFYDKAAKYKTLKSTAEELAAYGRDLRPLLNGAEGPEAAVAVENPDHRGWYLIVPCTNPANNKTFDHRQLEFGSLSPDAIRSVLPPEVPDNTPRGLDGWVQPRRPVRADGAERFVQAAARLLTHADWAVLSVAAYKRMDESPAAFDLLAGLLWSLRNKKVPGLPSRNVAWLVLKLMATVSSRARLPHANAAFCPLRSLPKRLLVKRRGDRRESPYPVSFPRGDRLESEIRREIDKHLRRRSPEHIDWIGLCHGLDQMLD